MAMDVTKAFCSTPATNPTPLLKKTYDYWRFQIMLSMFLGYAVFYFVRKNLAAATPAMMIDLSLSKTEIGLLWSLLYFTYGLSKLINGFIGDRLSARILMPVGLLASAITNIFFGLSSSFVVLCVLWGMNGWFQGLGWPPCAKLLTHWYSSNERGTKWAIWNMAHQIGAGVILIVGGFLVTYYGWRTVFLIPSAFAILTSLYLYFFLRDTPETLGLPDIETYRQDPEPETTLKTSPAYSSWDVLRSRPLWFLSAANFFVYLVRYGAMDWAPTFLVEMKQSTLASATMKAAGFEFLGILGAFLAGWSSDKFFKNKRWILNSIYMFVLTLTLIGFWQIPPGYPVLDALLLAGVGFLVYGPQMLVGVCAVDIVGKKHAGASTGLTGLFGYIGGIFSGLGMGYIVDQYSWHGGFVFLVASSMMGAILFLFTDKLLMDTQTKSPNIRLL